MCKLFIFIGVFIFVVAWFCIISYFADKDAAENPPSDDWF
jgi:hypothetical protein